MYKLLVVCLVFIIVFKPKDLPRLLNFVTKLISEINKIKHNLREVWDKEVFKQLQLEENIKKAREVDEKYSGDSLLRDGSENHSKH